MTDDRAYLLKDAKGKSIKQDHNGMLCVFLDIKDAKRFKRNLHPDDNKESEIIEVELKIKALTKE